MQSGGPWASGAGSFGDLGRPHPRGLPPSPLCCLRTSPGADLIKLLPSSGPFCGFPVPPGRCPNSSAWPATLARSCAPSPLTYPLPLPPHPHSSCPEILPAPQPLAPGPQNRLFSDWTPPPSIFSSEFSSRGPAVLVQALPRLGKSMWLLLLQHPLPHPTESVGQAGCQSCSPRFSCSSRCTKQVRNKVELHG